METVSVPSSHDETAVSIRDNVSGTRLAAILISVLLGMLLASLDGTIVGTAMPRVVAELGGMEHYAWVFTAYMLASTVMVPIYGKLSDIYGRKIFFVVGMVIFLVGSALSGMSQTMTQLIIFRALQGVGAAAMMPIAMAIIGDIFPPAERGKWQGILTAVFGLSSIVGPALGGWLTDNWGWRWVFYVNMPVGVVAIIAAMIFLPGQVVRRQHKIDYWGALTLVAGAVPLLLAFSWAGTEYAWGSPQILGLMAFAVVMIGLFLFIESRTDEAIISPGLFQNRIFSISMVAVFLTSAGMYGAIMYLPLFVQGVMGTSATNSGAVLTPLMMGFIVSSIISGQILSRTGKYKILALSGFVVAAFGMYLLSMMGVTTTTDIVIRNMVVTGLGIGVMMSLFTIVVQNAFPTSKLGEVTATLTFFRSIGGTIAVAVMGSLLNSRFAEALQVNMPDAIKQAVPAEQLAAFQNPQVLLSPEATARIQEGFAAFGPQGQAIFEQLMDAIRLSLATSITSLFMIGAVVMALAFIVTLFLQEIPLRRSNSATSAVAALGELGEATSFGTDGEEVTTAPRPTPTQGRLANEPSGD